MVEFLSDGWIAVMARACAGERDPTGDTEGGAGGARLVVEPVTRGVPGRGEVRYRMSFDATRCSVEPAAGGDAAPADVFLEADYATAVALARGETNAQAALAAGRLRVTGDVARLAGHAAALARLDDVFASVRTQTTYPEA